jgi:hypothetical protein
MGCDIHCYVEHTASDQRGWSSFGGRINPGRDYRMFAILADVRNYGDVTLEVVVSPRGFPADASWQAKSDNCCWVRESPDDTGQECSLASAEDWVERGLSHWVGEGKKQVTQPDWHSHSWLTPDEWQAALFRRGEAVQGGWGQYDPEYDALLAAMRAFESRGGMARIVFWFDN